MDTVRILNYLDMNFEQFIYLNRQSLDNLILQSEIIFTITCVALIVANLLLLFLLQRYYIKQQLKNIEHIGTIFTLISYGTVVAQSKQREVFLSAINKLE